MELKLGYKQTEVGIIPEDWEAIALGEIGESLIGLTYRPSDVSKSGTLVLRSSNVQNGFLNFDDNVFVSIEVPIKAIVGTGDILICARNGSRDLIGKCAKVDHRASGMAFGAFMAIFRSPANDFVIFEFQSEVVRRQIKAHLGATINQITNKSLNGFLIPLPPLREQQAIAEVLSDMDALIESLEKLIAKKRDMKLGAMQTLLTGTTRLPGFTGDWIELALGQVVVFRKGTLITEFEAKSGSVPVVAGGMTPSYFHDQANRFGQTITVSASGANAGYVSFHQIPIFASDCTTIEGSKNFDIRYLFETLKLKKKLIYRLQTGGAQPHVHATDLWPIKIVFAPLKEQEAIAGVLSDMGAEIEALEMRLAKTRDVKIGMAQELLTGKTRLI